MKRNTHVGAPSFMSVENVTCKFAVLSLSKKVAKEAEGSY
jgi:hypothetical protein